MSDRNTEKTHNKYAKCPPKIIGIRHISRKGQTKCLIFQKVFHIHCGGGAGVGQEWGLKAFSKQWYGLQFYTLQTHVEFTFNNQIIPHSCIIMMVSIDE